MIDSRNNKLREFVFDKKTRNICRLEEEKYKNTFTRDRKIPVPDLLLMTFNKQGKTTSFEIRDYELKKGEKRVDYTDEAYLKQRRLLNPKVFKEANKVYLTEFYNSDEVKTNKGYIQLAIDGSKGEVPNTPQNKEYFGYQKTKSETNRARAMFSGIYDVDNHFYLDMEVDKYSCDEVDIAKRNIEETLKILANHKLIITFDRNYPSFEFLDWLIKKKVKFLMRMASYIFKDEKKEMKTDDEYVDIKHTKMRSYHIKKKNSKYYEEFIKQNSTKVRFTKVKLNQEAEEYLVSNLSMDEFNSKELKQIYGNRWNIETSYNSIKNKLKIESFTGNLPQFVLQDIYAQTVVYNQIQDMIYHANQKLKTKNKAKNLKHGYQINENKAIGLFKEKFIKIIISSLNNQNKNEYDDLINEMTRYVSIVRKGRPASPRKWNVSNKYKPNMKSSF